MDNEPKETGIIPESKTVFDLGLFEEEFAAISISYSNASRRVESTHYNSNKLQQEDVERCRRLYDQLMDKCVDALKLATDGKEVIRVIEGFFSCSGWYIFSDRDKAEFYHDLLLRVIKTASKPNQK